MPMEPLWLPLRILDLELLMPADFGWVRWVGTRHTFLIFAVYLDIPYVALSSHHITFTTRTNSRILVFSYISIVF